MSEMIYGASDVARLLGVQRSAVSNYLARYTDTPTPSYVTTAGVTYWDEQGMAEWIKWHTTLSQPKKMAVMTEREAKAQQAIDDLRSRIGES